MGYVDVLTDRFRGVFQGKDSDPSQFGLKTGWVGKNLAEQLSRRPVLKGFAGAAATATGCTEAQYLFSDYKYVELEEIMENGLEPYYDEDFGGEKLVTDGYVEEIGLVETYPDNSQEARS